LITDFVDIKNAPDEFSAIKLCFVSHKTMTYKTYPHFAVIYRIWKPNLSLQKVEIYHFCIKSQVYAH